MISQANIVVAWPVDNIFVGLGPELRENIAEAITDSVQLQNNELMNYIKNTGTDSDVAPGMEGLPKMESQLREPAHPDSAVRHFQVTCLSITVDDNCIVYSASNEYDQIYIMIIENRPIELNGGQGHNEPGISNYKLAIQISHVITRKMESARASKISSRAVASSFGSSQRSQFKVAIHSSKITLL